MYEVLLRYLTGGAELSKAEATYVRSLFAARSLKKGQFFQRAGHRVTRGGFVVRGCFRTYAVDEQGTESIVSFSPEESWIGDLQSATTGEPTLYFVEAIEPSDVLVVEHASFETLLGRIPAVAQGFRLGIQRSRAAKERRILSSLHLSAEDRYAEYVQTHPSLARRIPLHMLASYLGMTPETLSRIRGRRRESRSGA